MKRFAMLVLTTLLAACATTQGAHTDTSKLTQLKPGVSTVADAEALLGKARSVTHRPDGGTTLGYSWSSVQTDGKSMIPIVGGFLGRGTSSSVEYTAVNFDKAGHYTNYSSFQN